MDARVITPRYSVSPQISAEDLPAIAGAGFKTVICNRPDAEVPPSHQAEAIRAAAEAAGLRFEVLPLTHQTMTPENAARQRALYEGCEGPVLAYCASGTRCSVVWALSQACDMCADDILLKTAAAGYQLDGLRPALDSLAGN
ncbi:MULTISPECIES: TIGR01244 family sulfur transferase [unclassified Leisingera]|uniref:TIGR01244 family sulfur transferase n=1 Tax=unclassified Leisingera TaxID=2614906 RepID=UPI001011432E|nr:MULTISPECIES: TIGR01244 family sulfur transferase [unclassified Leisingera]MBQ4824987.1 TIGR01244 family phosphatase [Leisingera sp. HS039]MCF6432839.1 TIGR01244 family sulfur transferase [Leisingera sp. MMG026]QAX29414.1 TIGR01244 family phosphatase [Leisingera sp. NJS204]